MERGGISLPAQLSPEGRNLNGMLFPYLSSTPLGKGRRSGLPGIHSGVWLLPDPWDSNPSVVLTELRTEVSLCCDGSWLYTGSNPVLTGRFAHLQEWRSLHAAADVAPHHRVVPEEWYALFKVQEKGVSWLLTCTSLSQWTGNRKVLTVRVTRPGCTGWGKFICRERDCGGKRQ